MEARLGGGDVYPDVLSSDETDMYLALNREIYVAREVPDAMTLVFIGVPC